MKLWELTVLQLVVYGGSCAIYVGLATWIGRRDFVLFALAYLAGVFAMWIVVMVSRKRSRRSMEAELDAMFAKKMEEFETWARQRL